MILEVEHLSLRFSLGWTGIILLWLSLWNPPRRLQAPLLMRVRPPMDRAPFPPLRAQSEENEQLEALATMLIDEYLEQFDHFQLQTYGLVRTEWSPLTQRRGIDVYQQRRGLMDPAMTEISLPRLMATGTIHGSLDDVMYATVAPTSEAMHVKMAVTGGDDIDGLLLHTIVPVLASEPFRFSSVKWLLRRPPSGLKSVVRQRDFVYLEATGINVRPDGERVGYHLCHSIEFASTPQLSRRGIVRGKMATCHFYRELAQSKVDVWAISTLDMQGDMWRRVAIAEGASALCAIDKLPALAVTKKLMWFQDHRPPHLSGSMVLARPSVSKSKSNSKCYNCDKSPHWPWKKRRGCDVCGLPVCSSCSDSVMVFPPGLDPRMTREKHRCCVTCVLNLADHNTAAYASQSCMDPSQRGSALSSVALGEDMRPKYDKVPSKFQITRKKKTGRARAGSSESSSTLTSSVVSRQSAMTCPEAVPREPLTMLETQRESLRRRNSMRVNLTDTLSRLQAVADATYVAQRRNGELFTLTSVYEGKQRRRVRASSSPDL